MRERVVIMNVDDGLWVTEVLRHNVTLASGTARWNETLTQRADSGEGVLTFQCEHIDRTMSYVATLTIPSDNDHRREDAAIWCRHDDR